MILKSFKVLNSISTYYNIQNFPMKLKYLIKYFWHICYTIAISKSGLAEVRGKTSFCTVPIHMMNNPVPRARELSSAFSFTKKALMWSDLTNDLGSNCTGDLKQNSFWGMLQNCILRSQKSIPKQLTGAIISLIEICGMITPSTTEDSWALNASGSGILISHWKENYHVKRALKYSK